MSLLESDRDAIEEVWEIRCFHPKKGLRLFGRFAAANVFIVLCWEYRENLPSDVEYAALKARCVRTWRAIFGDTPPFIATGGYPGDYIEGAILSTDPVV